MGPKQFFQHRTMTSGWVAFETQEESPSGSNPVQQIGEGLRPLGQEVTIFVEERARPGAAPESVPRFSCAT